MEESNNPSSISEPAYKKRSAWAALILTIFCKGLGHLYAGSPGKAFGFFILNILLSIVLSISLVHFILYSSLAQKIIVGIIAGIIEIVIYFDAVKTAINRGSTYVLKPYNKWYVYVGAIIFAGVISTIFVPDIFDVFQPYHIPTASMSNTLMTGDRLLANMTVYRTDKPSLFSSFLETSKPRKGDLAVYKFTGTRDEVEPKDKVDYIKRIIAVPGDTLFIKDKIVYVNGMQQPRPLTSKCDERIYGKNVNDLRIFPEGSRWNEDNYGPIIIPKKDDIIKLNADNYKAWEVFIKREHHQIELKNDSIILIDFQKISFYSVERNYYFVIGDNFNNSLDSRFCGFIPEENFVGKASYIYWSWDSDIPFSNLGKKIASIRWNRIGKLIE